MCGVNGVVCYNSVMLRSLTVLRHRDFRLLTLSTFLLFAARWMEVVVLGWMVLELTDSPFMVGVAGAFRFIGWSFGPLGGAISDRLERRRLLIVAQGVNTLTALSLLALLATDRLQVWQLFAAILIAGTTYAVDYPARNALVGDVVGDGELLNAMALNRAAQNLTAVVGPLLGGSLLLVVGYAGAYSL
ncbi:MAG: MFS transporter, partial [Chloroflexota bacterium]